MISEQSKRILIADDDVTSRLLIQELLKKKGISSLIAENGYEVLELYNAKKVDLILMDVQMPLQDGLTTTRLIREIEKSSGRHIPIIAHTAYAFEEDIKNCLAAGVDEYISKPVNIKIFYNMLVKFLG